MSETQRGIEADEDKINQAFELLKSKLIGQDEQVIIKIRNCLMSIAKREKPRTLGLRGQLYQLNFTPDEVELIFLAAETDWKLYVKLTKAAQELNAPLTNNEQDKYQEVIKNISLRGKLLIITNVNEIFPTDSDKEAALRVLRKLISAFMKHESPVVKDTISPTVTVISEKQITFLEELDPLDQLAYSEYLEEALKRE